MLKSLRVQGAIGFAIACLLLVGYIWYLMRSADAGAGEIVVREILIIGPLAFAFTGLLFAVLGDAAKRMLEFDENKLTFSGVLVLLVPVGLGALVYYLVNAWLAARGYR